MGISLALFLLFYSTSSSLYLFTSSLLHDWNSFVSSQYGKHIKNGHEGGGGGGGWAEGWGG